MVPVPGMRSEKRRRGRPVTTESEVGRARLLAVTEKLLANLPPSRVTMARVAHEAGTHPQLVAYYFRNRGQLLAETFSHSIAKLPHDATQDDPAPSPAAQIGATIDVIYQAPTLLSVVAEPADDACDVRAHILRTHLAMIHDLGNALSADGETKLTSTEIVFLYIAISGAAGFLRWKDRILEPQPADPEHSDTASDFRDFLIRLVLDGLRRR